MIWYYGSGLSLITWTCSEDDCSNCEGSDCSSYTLTGSTKGKVSDLPSFSDCRYGDTIEIKKIADTATGFSVNEIAVIKKQGNIFDKMQVMLYYDDIQIGFIC